MFARWCGACWGAALLALTVALASATLSEQRQQTGAQDTALLDALTVIFVVLACALLLVGVLFLLAFMGVWAHRYLYPVRISTRKVYCHFWPFQRIAEVSGAIWEAKGDWYKRVRVSWKAQCGDEIFSASQEQFSAGGSGSFSIGQVPVDFVTDPKAGDPVTVIFRVELLPRWMGRPTAAIAHANVGVIDHSPNLGSPEQLRDAIDQIKKLLREGQAILNECGYDDRVMTGAPPMHFLNECNPRILRFGAKATNTLRRVAPDYESRFDITGLITHNTDEVKAMIQQLDAWVKNLLAIEDALMARLLAPDKAAS
jgi:hypothetical protein